MATWIHKNFTQISQTIALGDFSLFLTLPINLLKVLICSTFDSPLERHRETDSCKWAVWAIVAAALLLPVVRGRSPPPLGYNEYIETVTRSDPKKQNAFCRARMLQPSPDEDEYTYKSGVISPRLSCHLFWLTPTPESWRETRGFRFLEKIFKFPLDSLVLPFVVLPFDSCSFLGAFTLPSWLIDQLSDKSIGQLETNCSWLEKS